MRNIFNGVTEQSRSTKALACVSASNIIPKAVKSNAFPSKKKVCNLYVCSTVVVIQVKEYLQNDGTSEITSNDQRNQLKQSFATSYNLRVR
jgi:hypothetical protein